MKKSIIDRWVYAHTQKPKHYVEVRNPPRTAREKRQRPQDARQVQYNRWSKHFKVYSGSYLPKDDRKLLRQGWEDKTHPNRNDGEMVFRRKSTGQWAEHGYNKGMYEPDRESGGRHWHWFTWLGKESKGMRKTERPYYDKYGTPCGGGNENSPHHIGEEGKDYLPWKKK